MKNLVVGCRISGATIARLHAVFPENIANRIEQKLLNNFGLNVKVPILELCKKDDKYYNMDKAAACCLELVKGLK